MTEELEAIKVFRCPEPGCTAVLSSQGFLDRHWDTGMHRYREDRESLHDFGLGEYVRNIEARGLEPLPLQGEGVIRLASESSQSSSSTPLEMGWALHKPRPPSRYTKEQKDFLVDLFWQGEESRFIMHHLHV
jgi:hypothetical protein